MFAAAHLEFADMDPAQFACVVAACVFANAVWSAAVRACAWLLRARTEDDDARDPAYYRASLEMMVNEQGARYVNMVLTDALSDILNHKATSGYLDDDKEDCGEHDEPEHEYNDVGEDDNCEEEEDEEEDGGDGDAVEGEVESEEGESDESCESGDESGGEGDDASDGGCDETEHEDAIPRRSANALVAALYVFGAYVVVMLGTSAAVYGS